MLVLLLDELTPPGVAMMVIAPEFFLSNSCCPVLASALVGGVVVVVVASESITVSTDVGIIGAKMNASHSHHKRDDTMIVVAMLKSIVAVAVVDISTTAGAKAAPGANLIVFSCNSFVVIITIIYYCTNFH